MALVSIDVGVSGTAAQTYRAPKTGGAAPALAAGTIVRVTWDDAVEAGTSPPGTGQLKARRNTAELASALMIAAHRVMQLETD